MAIPRALEPTGVILVDKPAGPTSFAVVARIRRRTGARTGHAGTLDPFATGLLVLLSGRATSLQDRFMKLGKRYLTTIDLHHRTSTGDPEGEITEVHEPVSEPSLADALGAMRGLVELRVPAASAVKISGERAYRLHRAGLAPEMPLRKMRIDRAELLSYEAGIATIELDVGSGTYIRSIADALGGHCVSLRRLEVGPFRVEEADEERLLALEDALPRLAA